MPPIRLLFLSFWIAAQFFHSATVVWAAYSNPILKVLLFRSSDTVTLRNAHGLRGGESLPGGPENRSVEVRRAGTNRLIVNGRHWVDGALRLTGKGTIQVVKAGRRTGRRYHGTIEIRPYPRGVYVMNHVPTETYLDGVLNAEISTQWHVEVVMAQAIIARTYALFKRKARVGKWWHLTAGNQDQHYMGANIADREGKRAIRDTRGLVVSYRGRLAQTFYHSNCGGVTEDPVALWRFSLPYLKVKIVPYGQDDPRYSWQHTMNQWDIRRVLKKARLNRKGRVREIHVTDRTESNRAAELLFVGDHGDETMPAAQFRRLAGYDKVQSLLFDVTKTSDGFHFAGYGNGHGVGLCQWAAKEMAESGYDYTDILHFFYDSVRIQLYNG